MDLPELAYPAVEPIYPCNRGRRIAAQVETAHGAMTVVTLLVSLPDTGSFGDLALTAAESVRSP